MNNTLFSSRPKYSIKPFSTVALCASLFLLSACGSSGSSNSDKASKKNITKTFTVQVGSDLNTKNNSLLSLNPNGPGGSSNQSLRAGDILQGSDVDDLLIGGLGVDILFGESGDDILIGGTEDFNSSVDGDEKKPIIETALSAKVVMIYLCGHRVTAVTFSMVAKAPM